MESGTLRILDANCNRAREALRVIEDYARFILNDDQLCSTLKQLRHDLQEATSSFVTEAILHRDTPGDVGTATKVTSELSREDVPHVITAAGKRLGEALRTIEEYLKTADLSNASRIETIRYRFYDLEQQIARTLRPAACAIANVRLYTLITENCCKRPWLEAASEAIAGGTDCIQLREKDMESGEFLRRAGALVELCKKHNVLCIINDRPDIAVLSGADGVHVGQGDLPAIEARKIVGPGRIVGVSTHNLDQARQAVRDGADYIGIGPVFKSPTKPRDFLPGLDFARQVAQANLPIPAVAIAGITLSNVDEVLATGIKSVAVTAAVIGADDIRAAARQFKEKLVGQAFLPVIESASPGHSCPGEQIRIGVVNKTRRHLPHWTMAGATYFITFRIKSGEFTMPERLTILKHIQSGDGLYYRLAAAVIMPDHVHALIEPLEGFDLSRVTKGIKGVSAKLVNEMRQSSGTLWQEESFDRIIRDAAEFEEKLKYVVDNPFKRELVADPWDYPALYVKFD